MLAISPCFGGAKISKLIIAKIIKTDGYNSSAVFNYSVQFPVKGGGMIIA
jgi:hypothetical protein